jgi:hypothetical protein
MRPNLPFVSAKHTLVTYNITLSLITKTNQGPRCFHGVDGAARGADRIDGATRGAGGVDGAARGAEEVVVAARGAGNGARRGAGGGGGIGSNSRRESRSVGGVEPARGNTSSSKMT